jgi:hypothetical protein
LLIEIRKCVGYGIQKMIYLIQEILDLAQNSTNFATRITNFKEYLQKYLENDEGLYKDVVGTFSAKVSILGDIHKREENLPSNIRMKQINVFWLKRIGSLREMINELDVVNNKRGHLLFKLIELKKELNGPSLLMHTILSTKEQLFEQLDILKVAWASEFIDSVKFSEE